MQILAMLFWDLLLGFHVWVIAGSLLVKGIIIIIILHLSSFIISYLIYTFFYFRQLFWNLLPDFLVWEIAGSLLVKGFFLHLFIYSFYLFQWFILLFIIFHSFFLYFLSIIIWDLLLDSLVWEIAVSLLVKGIIILSFLNLINLFYFSW